MSFSALCEGAAGVPSRFLLRRPKADALPAPPVRNIELRIEAPLKPRMLHPRVPSQRIIFNHLEMSRQDFQSCTFGTFHSLSSLGKIGSY